MKNEVLNKFYGYINHLYEVRVTYEKAGRHIKHVKEFLESDCEPTKRGYLQYRKTHADLFHEKLACDAILDFLSYIGQGWKRKGKKKESSTGSVQPLEKLSTMSEKNKEQMNGFMNWLYENCDYSTHTMRIYRDSIKGFFEHSTEFSLDAARRYIRTLEESGKSMTTIRLRMMSLERFGKYIKKPIELKRPKIQKTLDTDNVPSEKEYRRLLEYLQTKENKDYYFWLKVIASTGARVSEFLQFTWENVLEGEVTLKGKGNKYRRFFFSKKLQEEVREYVRLYGKSGIIATGRMGVITSRGLAQHMKEWGKKAGVDRCKMHPHAFRHFFAKMYLKNSKDVVQLAEILGHHSVDTTRIYLQKSKSEQMRDFNRNVNW